MELKQRWDKRGIIVSSGEGAMYMYMYNVYAHAHVYMHLQGQARESELNIAGGYEGEGNTQEGEKGDSRTCGEHGLESG